VSRRSELDDIEKQKAEEMGMSAVQDERFRILEMHVDLDLKGYEHEDEDGEKTGIALPYVVTVEKGTQKILPLDAIGTKVMSCTPSASTLYITNIYRGLASMDMVSFTLSAATRRARLCSFANSLMLVRSLILPGGLKSRGLRVKGDDTPIAPGEFVMLTYQAARSETTSCRLPYKEPSQVLYALFQNIVQEGSQFASAGDMNVSDMSAQAPVGTTLAILERTLKVMGAVQARMHYSMRQEFRS
jgi:hypothetical protein